MRRLRGMPDKHSVPGISSTQLFSLRNFPKKGSSQAQK